MFSSKYFHAVWRIDSDKYREKHDEDSENTDRCYVMLVDQAWEKNCQCLPQRHDDGENNRTELFNRKEDKELAHCWANRQNDAIDKELWVFRRELKPFYESSLDKKGSRCEHRAEEIDSESHLKARDAVAFEYFALPVGSETVKHHIHAEKEEPG